MKKGVGLHVVTQRRRYGTCKCPYNSGYTDAIMVFVQQLRFAHRQSGMEIVEVRVPG